jgi:hypothetical protein
MHYVLMWHGFSIYPFTCKYNFQHFQPIQYVNGLSRSLLTFQINDSKITIDFNDFLSFLESMM